MEIYLDNAATTKPFEIIAELLKEYIESGWHNPSSAYKPAAEALSCINKARKFLLESLGVVKGGVIFTSGGTEANITAVKSGAKRKKHIITTQTEHPSVYQAVKALSEEGYRADFIKPGSDYLINPGDVASAICEDTAFVSVMHVNNETGAINDIEEIARQVKKINENIIFHSDGVQAFMKIPYRINENLIDMYSISAHKINALKGTGALYAADKKLIKPLILGGGQEGGLRAGTENTLGIFAFMEACRIYSDNFSGYIEKMKSIRERMKNGLCGMKDVAINSAADEKSAPHILNASFMGVRGETLVHSLSEAGILIGTVSACSSKKSGQSRVLKAMGFDKERLEGAVRISFSPLNTEKQADIALEEIKKRADYLRRYKRR